MAENDQNAGRGLTPGDLNRPAQTSSTYDGMYRSGGYEGVYNQPYRRSTYYPLFKAVVEEVRRHGSKQVLEVGCGVVNCNSFTMPSGG